MKQFVVIGLGNFGKYLCAHLYERGHEVLALDKRPGPVQDIKDKVTRAVVGDATDRKTLESLDIRHVDAAVVSIGSVLSNSILATLNLKDLGINRILAKALSEEHGRILEKIGASEVFFPEKDIAVSLAARLDNPNLLEYLPFIEGYSMIELAPAKKFIGKALSELNLINRYGVQVVAVKEVIPDRLNMIPTGHFVVKDSDILILLGPNDALAKLREE